MLRERLAALLRREAAGEAPINLGQQENLMIPLIHGATEFDYTVARGGEKAKEDFRCEMSNVMYAFEKLINNSTVVIWGSQRDHTGTIPRCLANN